MSQFRFAQLEWLHAIWAVLLLTAVLVYLELRGRSVLDQMLSRFMQTRLVTRTSLARRLSSIGLIFAAMMMLVLAMMRPQWGVTVQHMTRVDSQIMVCLDVSKSMLAEDAAPNRLERAKAELDSLLGLMDEGQQVGLIAFAGRATVLCPMTTDFGFLRLILADAEPSSVGRGGTKIGEALRKAVDGFGEAGDVNRVIMLITDGEDHDSFPLDAAAQAKERGIRVICIGFGDEAGSKIEITDPRTGVRSFVQDRDGKDVISRLDGETLRRIALETEGAYVPAGTGALDLESIYDRHVATMLQGTQAEQQREIRNEAFQWCVLAALLLLVLALLAASPWSLKTQAISRTVEMTTGPAVKAAVIVLMLACWTQMTARLDAQPPASTAQAPDPAAEAGAKSDEPADLDAATASEPEPEEDVPPRVAYNRALAFVSSDPDRADELLNLARRDAKADGELRYRSLYNLGWLEVKRADALLEEQPQEALNHLQQAANRFREAIRVRPGSQDARHNLEIVSRRILELSDALAQQDPRDLAERLDEIIAREREMQSELASLVQLVASDASQAAVDQHRGPFRQAAIVQRQIIADLQKMADDARRELDALMQKKEEELSDEQRLRGAQLTGVMRFVDSGLQRLQKARGLTRRRQGSRAFTRWSTALTDTKRARDQLRNPLDVLGVILADARQLSQFTRLLADADSLLTQEQDRATPPAWLSQDYLQETQTATTERTTELTAMLTAASAQPSSAEAETETDEKEEDAQAAAQTEKLMQQIKQAVPFLGQAVEAFTKASAELEAMRTLAAHEQQITAIAALEEAVEVFFDIRRLIERIYADQQNIRDATGSTESPESIEPLAPVLQESIGKNRTRCERLDGMFVDELNALQGGQAPVQGPAPADAPPPDPNIQRYETARQILAGITEDIDAMAASLVDLAPGAAATDSMDESYAQFTEHTGSSIAKLEELRRLFFSLIEHLRDTGQRQAQLTDETNELAGNVDRQSSETIGPLGGRQQMLGQIADQISQALRQQAEQARQPATDPSETDPSTGGPPADPGAADRFEQAGQLVQVATDEMNASAGGLVELTDSDSRDFTKVLEHQTTALQKIAEALAILDDAQDQEQQQQNQQQQNQDQQDQQDQQQNQQEQEQQEQEQQRMNAEQLLQLIRDREAQRRKDRNPKATSGSGAVDRDW